MVKFIPCYDKIATNTGLITLGYSVFIPSTSAFL